METIADICATVGALILALTIAVVVLASLKCIAWSIAEIARKLGE